MEESEEMVSGQLGANFPAEKHRRMIRSDSHYWTTDYTSYCSYYCTTERGEHWYHLESRKWRSL